MFRKFLKLIASLFLTLFQTKIPNLGYRFKSFKMTIFRKFKPKLQLISKVNNNKQLGTFYMLKIRFTIMFKPLILRYTFQSKLFLNM